MNTYSYKTLLELPKEHFKQIFIGKRIKVTTNDKSIVGHVNEIHIDPTSDLPIGFIIDNDKQVGFYNDTIVEIL